MKRITHIILGLFCCLVLSNTAMSANLPNLLKICQDEKKGVEAARACAQIGDMYWFERKKQAIPAVYYWRRALNLYDQAKTNNKNYKRVEKNILAVFASTSADAPRMTKMCLALPMLPWSFTSNIISNKNNTIDQNIEAMIGSYHSLISHAKIGLGMQIDYSLQTFVNSIGMLFNSGTDMHILTLMYLLGKAYNPNDIKDGMSFMLETGSSWSFNKDLFDGRNPMPQYGIALQIIYLMKNDQIKSKLLQDIVSSFVRGDTANAANLLVHDANLVAEALHLRDDIYNTACKVTF